MLTQMCVLLSVIAKYLVMLNMWMAYEVLVIGAHVHCEEAAHQPVQQWTYLIYEIYF